MERGMILSFGESIISCAVKASYQMNAKLIIVFTNKGISAQTVLKYRPQCPILAVTSNER